MFSKCLLLLFFSTFIEAQYSYDYHRCPYPQLANGRVRIRAKAKMVKFICEPRYELVGNRYATCRAGSWDVPKPVCVRSGCLSFTVQNAVQIRAHHEAWVTTFCMPGYKLVGSAATYCNGYRWNATAPKCLPSTAVVGLSCDFEDSDICGWMQDDHHDFDWTRHNSKTPTSFLNTGPSYDHTLGKGGNGYYMYIESSSKRENSSARLLSPIFYSKLATDGCFSFFYHMFGRSTGGLRVYQKPDKVTLSTLLDMSYTEMQQYILFEQWGNLGDFWYSAAPQLRDFHDDFQIVIEGIRGSSFTSDIAIDDVALLQGINCTQFRNAATTPVPLENAESCAGRCHDSLPVPSGCECSLTCFERGSCCADFLEVCAFNPSNPDSDDDDISTTETLSPQTEKLVGETTLSTTTSTTTFTPKSTRKPTTTQKPITIPSPPTTKLTTTKSTTPKTTISISTVKITTPKPTTLTSTTLKPTTWKTTTLKTTTLKPTTLKSTTLQSTTTKLTTSTLTPRFVLKTTPKSATTQDWKEEEEQKSQKEINVQKMTNDKLVDKSSQSSGWKTAVITILVIAVVASIVYLGIASRTNRGRVAIARLTGKATGSDDSEVRYLNANDDDL